MNDDALPEDYNSLPFLTVLLRVVRDKTAGEKRARLMEVKKFSSHWEFGISEIFRDSSETDSHVGVATRLKMIREPPGVQHNLNRTRNLLVLCWDPSKAAKDQLR